MTALRALFLREFRVAMRIGGAKAIVEGLRSRAANGERSGQNGVQSMASGTTPAGG